MQVICSSAATVGIESGCASARRQVDAVGDFLRAAVVGEDVPDGVKHRGAGLLVERAKGGCLSLGDLTQERVEGSALRGVCCGDGFTNGIPLLRASPGSLGRSSVSLPTLPASSRPSPAAPRAKCSSRVPGLVDRPGVVVPVLRRG